MAHAVGIGPWWFVAGTGVASIVSAAVCHNRFGTLPEAAYGAVVPTAAGCWLALAAGITPWSTSSLASLALGSLVLGPAYGLLRWRRDARAQKELDARAQARADARRSRWSDILAKSGAKDIEVEDGPTFDAGFKLLLTLGSDAPKFSTLVAMTAEIEKTAAAETGLPIRPGSIQIQRGMYAHQAVMVVPTRDVLSETIEFPDKDHHGPRSIKDPVFLGQYVDANQVEVTLRGRHGMFAGMTNFGKSALLDTHMVQTTRCVDNVTWAIAGNKGVRWLRPWLLPWLRGYADRPPIDWMALDVDEALRIGQDLYRAIDTRQALPGNGTNGWDPTAENPQITIFIDESTDLLESTKRVLTHKGEKVTFADLLLLIVRTARSEGIHVYFCSQRGTASLLGMSGGDLKSQIAYRVGFRAQGNMTDTNAVFSTNTTGIELTALPKGAWYVELDGFDRPALAKGYLVDHAQISTYAIEATAYVGGVDAATAACMEHYAERWSRPTQLRYLAQINGGPLRPELLEVLTGSSTPASGSASTLGPRPAASSERARDGIDGEYDASEILARIERWANSEADSENLASLEVMWDQPEIPDGNRNTGHQAFPPETLALVAALHASGALNDDPGWLTGGDGNPWLRAADIRVIAAEALDWPNNSEGDRQVTTALEALGIESRRISQKKVTAYRVADLRAAVERIRKPDEDS
jgi:hypothetical protein